MPMETTKDVIAQMTTDAGRKFLSDGVEYLGVENPYATSGWFYVVVRYSDGIVGVWCLPKIGCGGAPAVYGRLKYYADQRARADAGLGWTQNLFFVRDERWEKYVSVYDEIMGRYGQPTLKTCTPA